MPYFTIVVYSLYNKLLNKFSCYYFIIFIIVRSDIKENQEKPTVTLYTKDPCPLCDELKTELAPFMPHVQFETVDITKKDNVRWLRLYRYDIPVLFFNGQFLCKHRLNVDLLIQKLKEFDTNKIK